ncbi:MAG: hypothetical protein DHS20C15_11250 [Planctomycetota bacterium]|nr:MAG: hypothetical protein DHS20C15_11250 [Planctomycetota bacterium]
MHPRVIASLLFALLGALTACGDDAPPTREVPAAIANFVPPGPDPGDLAARDDPAIALRGDHGMWLAWRAWSPEGDRLEIMPHRFQDAFPAQPEPVVVHRASSHVLGVALAADAEQTLHLVWSEQRSDGWVLRESRLPKGAGRDGLGEPGEPIALAGGAGAKALDPVLAADSSGRLLLVWQHSTVQGLGLRARLFQNGEWGDELELGARPHGNWAPDVAATGDGRFAVVWDAAVDGDYDVLLARLSARDDGSLQLEARHRVTDTARFEAHPSVVAHGERLYVAYEVASDEQWGREGSHNKVERALHVGRTTEVVVVQGDRRARLKVPFMQDIGERLRDSVEKPVLRVDGGGNLLMFFRGHDLPPERSDPSDPEFRDRVDSLGGGGVGWRSSHWRTYVSTFDGTRWGGGVDRHQAAFPDTLGRSDAAIAVAQNHRGGLGWAAVGDGREPRATDDPAWFFHPITTQSTDLNTGFLRVGETRAAFDTTAFEPLPPVRAASPADTPRVVRRSLADGSERQLVLGDLHRHTDLSRCSSNMDGPFSDAFRYAHDVGRLQFVAITDHFEHMTAYEWWRSLAWMDAYDMPGRTSSLRAYERSDQITGHRNVIAGSDELPVVGYRDVYRPARQDADANTPADLWQHFLGADVITIPHTPAGMFDGHPSMLDWIGFHPEYDRVVEVFQGYRGSSEAIDAPRAIDVTRPNRFVRPALDGGMHFGLIASSDHQSSDGAFAGAWARDISRGEVFGALHERLCFASTARMSLWMEWDGALMGQSQQREAGRLESLQLEVELFDRTLDRAELFVNGALVEERPLSGASAELSFSAEALRVPEQGEVYAYVRVRTTDGELGWTSPIRFGAAGWNGPDGLPGDEAYTPELSERLELDGPFFQQRKARPDAQR